MKTLSLAMALACLTVTTYSQESEKYQKAKVKANEVAWDEEKSEKYNDWKAKPDYHEGYVIDIDSNKVEGIVIDKAALSVKIILPSGETRRYHVTKCIEYGFDLYKFISMGNFFVQVVYDLKTIGVYKRPVGGDLTLGGAPVTMNGQKGTGYLYYIRKKNGSDFEPVRDVNFTSKFSKYFSDCPYLKENIKKKTLTSSENDLTAIAAIYDRECAPTNK